MEPEVDVEAQQGKRKRDDEAVAGMELPADESNGDADSELVLKKAKPDEEAVAAIEEPAAAEQKQEQQQEQEQKKEEENVESKPEVEEGKKVEEVKLGPMVFTSGVEMFTYFYELLHGWATDHDINEYEHMVLTDLITKGHSDPPSKIKTGIASFQVRNHPKWRSRCYYILRPDGTFEDFSYRKCVDKLMTLPPELFKPTGSLNLDSLFGGTGKSKRGGHSKGGAGRANAGGRGGNSRGRGGYGRGRGGNRGGR